MTPIRFCIALALAGTPFVCVTLAGQPSAGSAAPAANATPSLQVGEDAKEKAEDAALLQQLETPSPKASTQTRTKGQFYTDKAPRGEGRAGAASVQPFRLKNVINRPTSGARTLMVRSTAPEAKDQLAMEEDLAIMSRVLVKAIEELPGRGANKAKFMGIDVFFTPGGSQLRSLYVENYGALFFLNVNFPLVAPQEKRIEGKPAADSAWEDARQELYGQRSQELVGEASEEYSEERVDRLKGTLLEALKNAANIRGLKSTDFVTLWISGASTGPGSFRVVHAGAAGNGGAEPVSVEQLATASKRSVLTIRATKAEIDAFAQGKVTSESFQKKAMMTAYTSDAGSFGGDTLFWDAGRVGF